MDFGEGVPTNLNAFTIAGTFPYMAPELFEKFPRLEYDAKVDVYAFGLVIWEILSKKKIPHHRITSGDDSSMTSNVIGAFPTPPLCESWDSRLRDIIKACWTLNPKNRPSSAEVDQLLDHISVQ